MTSRHLIDECRVELAFRVEQEALDGQLRWESFVKKRLLVVAEEVFDEVSVPGQIRRFERLTVDLGSADPQTSGPELERRMREQLLAAMRGAMHRSESRAPSGGRALTRAVSDFEQVRHFLSCGRLPWHGGQGAGSAIDAAIRRVLEAQAAAFARWLRDAARSPSVIPRLARQFPEDMLEPVGILLAPDRAAFLSALARLLQALFDDTGSGTGTASGAGRIVWEALISAVLACGAATIDESRLARDAIKRAARLRGGSNGATAAALRGAVSRLRVMDAPTLDVGGAFRALRRATTPDGIEPLHAASMPRAVDGRTVVDREPASERPAGSWEWSRLSARLARALMRGDALSIRALWDTLVSDHAPLVIAVVRERGALAKVRLRMAEGFPEPMLHDLVRLLEPMHSDFIGEIVQCAQWFQAGIVESPARPDTLRRRMWAFTLAYLLVERSGSFNEEAYVGSVVRQVAAFHNHGYAQLLGALTGEMDDIGTRSAARIRAVELLRRLARRAGSTDSPELDMSSGETLVQGARAYDHVVTRLLRGRRPTDDQSDQLIDSVEHLASEFPWQFVRLVRELEAHGASAARVADRLSIRALRRFILAIVALARPRADSTASEFAESLDAYALRTRDPQRYLARVLDHLLAGKPVDLEAIEARTGERALIGSAHPVAVIGNRAARRRLKLLLEDWVARGTVDAIAPEWEELVRARSPLVRTVLRSRGRSESVRRVIVRSATDSMLRDIVHVLEPAQADFIDGIVQCPGLPGRGAGPMRNAEGVRRRLWDFTLGYLLADRGGQFSRKAYIGSLERQMAAHDSLAAETGGSPVGGTGPLAGAGAPRAEDAADSDRCGDSRPARSEAIGAAVSPAAPGESAASDGAGDLAAIVESLSSSRTLPARRRQWLAEAIDRQIVNAPQALRNCLAKVLRERRAIQRLISALPESLLNRLLAILCPSEYATVVRSADLIATALLLGMSASPESRGADLPGGHAQRGAPGRRNGSSPATIARWKWQFILEWIVAEGRTFDVARFARGFVGELRGRCSSPDAPGLHECVLEQLARSGIPSDRGRIETIAEALTALGAAGEANVHPAAGAVERPASHHDSDPAATLESLHVTNAGQVLAAPYLPQLFSMLELTANGCFKDAGAAERAIHLLQFMVDGSTDSFEHLLPLNKILCGVALDTPIARDVCLTATEKDLVEGMIRGMIGNWKAIGSTSVAGLRESFFQREGRLQLKDDSWHLLVEPRAFDMLLDRLPWGYATIKHPWMDRIVHVEWR